MAEDLQSAAVQLAHKGSIETFKVLMSLVTKMLEDRKNNGIEHGQQSLKTLNNQGRQLESVNIPGEDIKAFRRELNHYNVDFSVMKDKSTGENTVFFKAQDVDRVYKGLEKCVKGLSLPKDRRKKSIQEVMETAAKKAKEQGPQDQNKDERHKKKEVEHA